MKKLLPLLIMLFTIYLGHSQQTYYPEPLNPNIPFSAVIVDEDTPSWAKLLYSSNPNMDEVSMQYNHWRKSNPKVKDGHTRNLKHYMAFLIENDGIDEGGFVSLPTVQEKTKQQKDWLRTRNRLSRNSSRSTGNVWEPIGPLFVPETQGRVNAQSNIYSIAQSKSNPDVLYCGTETDCVFKSINKGDSWFSLCEDYFWGGPMELEINPTDPNIVYLGTSHEIWKTTDGGQNWNSVYNNSNINISTIIIHPTSPDTVLAGGNEGLFISHNGGQSWQNYVTDRIYDLKFKTNEPNVVFSLRHNSLNVIDFYRSTDIGITWTKITQGWEEPDPSSGIRGGRMTVSDSFPDVMYTFTGASYTTLDNPKNGVKVRKSSDGGISWNLVYDSDTPGPSNINNGQGYYDWDIEMMDADTNVVVLGTQGRWLTTDGFATSNWTKEGSEIGHSDLQEALFMGNDLWIASDGGIIKLDTDFNGYSIKMEGINCAEFWSFDQGWNRDAQVGSLYHNGTIGRTNTYDPGQFRFFGGAEPEFSALKQPYPDKIISKGYGSVNGRSLPDNFEDGESSFKYNLLPNAYIQIYDTHKESEIEILPYAYNTHFAGEANHLWRSDNFGLSWYSIFEGRMDGLITKIEIPKVNPSTMYVAEYHSSGYKIYKSIDGGTSFSALNNLPMLSTNNEGIHMSGDDTDENVLFIAFRKGGTGNDKVWKTTDGGATWVNINSTSDAFDGQRIRVILAISGTDGGLYAGTNHGIYYRNNTTDWMACIDGLPVNLNIRHIKPFYKEGKIRIATMRRGVYGSDMIDQPNEVQIQPTVNLVSGMCTKDTFYFEDYSVLNHEGADWSWTFSPSPAYVDDSNKRNPKVVFPESGTYMATLTIQKNGQTYIRDLDKPIVISSGCDADEHAGGSYKMTGNGDHGYIEDEGLILSEFSVSYWVRPNASHLSTATMFSTREGSDMVFCVNYYGSSANPTLHYKGAGSRAWGVNPGLSFNYEEWNHVVVTSSVLNNEVKIYVNGVSFTYPSINAVPISFEKMYIGWQYRWWNGRYFNGEMDELAIYDKILSQDDVRLDMHFTKQPTENPNLIHYYQWNETNTAVSYDKSSNNHMVLATNIIPSRAPIGVGSSSKMVIDDGGIKEFPDEGIMMQFPSVGTYPDGEIVVTRLDTFPDEIPQEASNNSENYWIINNYGNNKVFTPIEEISFTGFGSIPAADLDSLGKYQTFKRKMGQDSLTWSQGLNISTEGQINPNTTLTFSPSYIDTFGQFTLGKVPCESSAIVMSASSSGFLSLRDLVSRYCPNDTITFSLDLMGDTLVLNGQELNVNKSLNLIGPGSDQIFISGGHLSRILNIPNAGVAIRIEGVSLIDGGASSDGGAFINYGNLNLKNVKIKGNKENGQPKGFTNYGEVIIEPGEVEILD